MLPTKPRVSRGLAAAIALALLALTGCQPARPVTLQYVNQSDHDAAGVRFAPVHIAVEPLPGGISRHTYIGSVYDAQGNLAMHLRLADSHSALDHAIAAALAHRGLKPTLFPPAAPLPSGVDFVLACAPIQLRVIKRLGAEHTAHGEFFTMQASAALSCKLSNRSSRIIYQGEVFGMENEPPLGPSTDAPMVADPGMALSVAVSRAVDSLIDNSTFRAGLPTASTPPAH